MPTYLDNYLKGLRALTPAIVKRAMKPSERTYALCQPKETYNGDLDSVTATRDLFELELYDHVMTSPLTEYLPCDLACRQTEVDTDTAPSLVCSAPLGRISETRRQSLPGAAHVRCSLYLPRACPWFCILYHGTLL